MMRLTRALLLFVVASSLAAAEARLGPETPLAPSGSDAVPAAFEQTAPRVASNGRGFLAVWEDRRGGFNGPIYATPLDSDGRPLVALGRRIGNGSSPVITADGAGYAIAWIDSGTIRLLRVDESANPIESIPARAAGEVSAFVCIYSPLALLDISTNGTTYVIRWTSYCYATYYVTLLVQRDAPPRSLTLDATKSWSLKPAGATTFTTLHESEIESDLQLAWTVFNETGVVSSRPLLRFSRATAYTAAASEDRVLFARRGTDAESDSLFIKIIDSLGNVIAPETTIHIGAAVSAICAHWDGREFLVDVRFDAALSVYRIGADGKLLSAQPYALSSTAIANPAFATNGSSGLYVWPDRRFSGYGDIVSRVATDRSEANLVSLSGRAQIGVQVATAGSHRMAVWSDGLPREISGTLDGAPLSIASAPGGVIGLPAVIAGDRSFLVAWRDHPANAANLHLLARRYAFDGTPLDAQPLVLASDLGLPAATLPFMSDAGDRPGIAFDGTSFLVAAGDDPKSIRLVRVDAASGASQSASYQSPRTNATGIGSVRVVPGADHWLVIFTSMTNLNTVDELGALSVSASLASVRRLPLEFIVPVNDEFFSLVPDPERMAYAFIGTGLELVQITPNAQKLRYVRLRNDYPLRFELAWNGSEYVLAFTDYNQGQPRVRVIRLSAEGMALDAEPIDIASGVAFYLQPSIAVTANGVFIAYSKAGEAYGGAARAYGRTLDRLLPLPTPPRRSAVRH